MPEPRETTPASVAGAVGVGFPGEEEGTTWIGVSTIIITTTSEEAEEVEVEGCMGEEGAMTIARIDPMHRGERETTEMTICREGALL